MPWAGWLEFVKEVPKVKACGYPADRMEKYRDQDPFFKTFQYEAEGEAEILEKEGFINYKIFSYVGMSGSPIFLQNKAGDYYVVGLHWGKMRGVTDKTCGVLLKESNIAQI